MVGRMLTAVLAVAAFSSSVAAQKGTRASPCPAESPCGGLYGDCGVGAFCLGGCDPTTSHSLKSCVPGPVCKSGSYKLNSLDDIQSIDKYLGDNSKINWQSQGLPVVYKDQALLLTMAEGTVGTLLASTFYVWYGKICTKMTTSQGAGVVTAFIMMSDVKDEIDFEFIGVDINDAQSNFYSQGVTNYNNSKNLTVSPETVSSSHEYCIDWNPDSLTWIVDGKSSRTVNRKDTWNSTSNRFDYPQTPSRIMLSLWPAGLQGAAKGTVDWAGGYIDWNSKYMQNGYYYAMVESVDVKCYDPPSGTKKGSNPKSYRYNDKAVTNNTVELSDDYVVLGSLLGTGENPGSPSQSVSSSKSQATVNMVPGGNPGGGIRQETPTAAAAAASGGGGAAAAATSGAANSNNGGGGSAFIQGTPSGAAMGAEQPGLAKVGGSALAIVLAVLGLVVL